MRILYSFNKRGFEAAYWQRELAAASTADLEITPFNHDPYLESGRYLRAQALDNVYYNRDAGLLRMYADLKRQIAQTRATVLVVDTCHPYHPEFLRSLDLYKVIRIADGPAASYDRDFAYLHAYDHVLYHTRAYSRDLTMPEKLAYCGAKRYSFWPLALFDTFCMPQQAEEEVFAGPRDIDIIFVGALYVDKMPLLASVRRAFGRRFQIHGLSNWKKNLYFNVKYGSGVWVRPLCFEDYVGLYRRARIGINAHLRGKYTVGNYRMFELPGNGVMQITDGGEYVADFFAPGREIETYDDADEAVRKLDHYLTHPGEREEVARQGYRRVMADHRIGKRLRDLREILSPSTGG